MRRIFTLGLMALCALNMMAQSRWNDYRRNGEQILYQGQALADADAATFEELGFGYGKDQYNVYYRGEVLEFVNPRTFQVDAKYTRHHKIGSQATMVTATPAKPKANSKSDDDEKGGGLAAFLSMGTTVKGTYSIHADGVSYEGVSVKGADTATFKDLSAGYGCDKKHAYYKGKVIRGALGGKHFSYVGDDYATDGLHTYFKGQEVERE